MLANSALKIGTFSNVKRVRRTIEDVKALFSGQLVGANALDSAHYSVSWSHDMRKQLGSKIPSLSQIKRSPAILEGWESRRYTK